MEIPEAPDKEMWAKTVSTAVMVKGNEGKIYGGVHAAGVWSVTVVLGIRAHGQAWDVTGIIG